MEGFILTQLVFLRRIVFLAYFLACAPVLLHAEPVRISYSAISWLMTPMWMAEELGLFKKYNLAAQLIYIPSSATSVQALLGGRCRFTSSAATLASWPLISVIC
jgi:ABC-type nitrate/sulfonate/bicarbonate transport system substrate-binding protein